MFSFSTLIEARYIVIYYHSIPIVSLIRQLMIRTLGYKNALTEELNLLPCMIKEEYAAFGRLHDFKRLRNMIFNAKHQIIFKYIWIFTIQ